MPYHKETIQNSKPSAWVTFLFSTIGWSLRLSYKLNLNCKHSAHHGPSVLLDMRPAKYLLESYFRYISMFIAHRHHEVHMWKRSFTQRSCVSRGSCVESGKLLQVMSLEWASVERFENEGILLLCSYKEVSLPYLCHCSSSQLEASGYTGHNKSLESQIELLMIGLHCGWRRFWQGKKSQ